MSRPPLLAFLLLLGLGLACTGPGSQPLAVDGRLDLSRWSFEADGDVALLGDWEICWGELLEPEESCRSSWQPVPVRGLWTEAAAGSPFGGRGVATYRLRIALPGGDGPLSLVAGAPLTAHRLWIDGAPRGGVGVVGPGAETTAMGVRNRVYALPARAGQVELLVQVANFEFRSGGLRRIWFIGQDASIQRGIGRAILREGMLFAVGVLVGVGYLALFALGRSERARGYFGLASLVLGLRAVAASISGFGELVAPWAGFELLTRGEYLGTALAIFAGAGYARTKVPGVAPPRTLGAIQLVALALAAIVAAAPFPVALATLPLQYLLPVVVLGLFIGCYGWAWLRGVAGVQLTAIASALYLLVVLHDILRTLQSDIGAAVELYPYALVVWILAEAFELLQRFYHTFAHVESLSEQLAEANFELQETEAAIVRFVPFDFLRLLGKQSIREVEAGDRVRSQMSVLHCGLQPCPGAPNGTPESGFGLVSRIVARVEPLVRRHGGFVNEFAGEGFQAFFPDGPKPAVAAAIEIVEIVRRVAEERASAQPVALAAGIGIDTGPVLLGTVGAREHLLRGVVGEAVDAARRIAALAARSQAMLLISASTRQGLGETSDYEVCLVATPEAEQAGRSLETYEVRERRSRQGG